MRIINCLKHCKCCLEHTAPAVQPCLPDTGCHFHEPDIARLPRVQRPSHGRHQLTELYSFHTCFSRSKVVFLKISQELRTKDYYTLFKIHTLKDQKSSTGQLENSFDFDMTNLISKLTMATLRRHRFNESYYPSQAIPGVGAHLHTPGHHGDGL